MFDRSMIGLSVLSMLVYFLLFAHIGKKVKIHKVFVSLEAISLSSPSIINFQKMSSYLFYCVEHTLLFTMGKMTILLFILITLFKL